MRIRQLPGLSLDERPALFDAILRCPLDDVPTRVEFAGTPGLIIIDGRAAQRILCSRRAEKGRSQPSRAAVGGYVSLTGDRFRQRRHRVVEALDHVSFDVDAMAEALAQVVAASNRHSTCMPNRAALSAIVTTSMLAHLSGAMLAVEEVTSAVVAMTKYVEDAQSYEFVAHETPTAAAALHAALTVAAQSIAAPFTSALTRSGFSSNDIATELLGLALAGWESTAAALNSAVLVGLSTDPTSADLDELLRLYPPSWLIVRRVQTSDATSSSLAVVSPWLIHRDERNWHQPLDFRSSRFDGQGMRSSFLPFGAGERKCPAERYARAHIRAALSLFGGQTPTPVRPGLLHRRSATALPVSEGASHG